ncbi:MAG: MarC family protein [Flavobacteriales bacterium]|nr:MarC family protein [Flavobacteriales bacterium]MDG1781464.1 MarC family protein [Flavobacteriales bacterium]MDG2246501.1 MarC family protein [Flavobacteriales bacterium]
MKFNPTDFLSATMVLFAVIDIVGSIPIILDVKKKAGDIHELRASLVSLGIMIGFLFLGEKIIHLLGIDVNSFAVAGAFVLFFLALEMVLGVEFFKQDETTMKTATIVPIAFPLIAGAGTMTTIVSLRSEYSQLEISMAILVNIIIVFLVLKSTNRIGRALGEGGIAVLRKVFGIILLAIAVKLFSTNVKELF